jgi:hypothetical protein
MFNARAALCGAELELEEMMQETTQAVAGETAAKESKSYSIRLVSQGGDEQMVLRAVRTGTGWRTKAVHSVPDGKTKLASGKVRKRKYERGATATHPTFEAAKATIEKLAAGAVKAGWLRPERKALGFVAKPDAFTADQLPKPSKPRK